MRFFEFICVVSFLFLVDQIMMNTNSQVSAPIKGPQIRLNKTKNDQWFPLCDSRTRLSLNLNHEFRFRLSDRTCDDSEPFLSLPDHQKRSIDFDAMIQCSIAREGELHQIAIGMGITATKRHSLPQSKDTAPFGTFSHRYYCQLLNETQIDSSFDISYASIKCVEDRDLSTCRFASKLVNSDRFVICVCLCFVMFLISFVVLHWIIYDNYPYTLNHKTKMILGRIAILSEFITVVCCVVFRLYDFRGAILFPLLTPFVIHIVLISIY